MCGREDVRYRRCAWKAGNWVNNQKHNADDDIK